jgi:hypothetical protein
MPGIRELKDIERINLEGNQIATIDTLPKTLVEINLKENK